MISNADERRLRGELLEVYAIAKEELSLTAPRFLQMLEDKGAIQTARELVMRQDITLGLERLWERSRLDLSIEAVVLRPQNRHLFPSETLAAARRRLESLGYTVPTEGEEKAEGHDLPPRC